ncbi:hypothetical protein CONPUDRAFT_84579 [Coniophora puteana RWD-64-598 SS2]|uniref:Uncharacterized protein n=1 Tax=Coniophora puteana (strain RWD-64-598) TaxID=741705 RepID=A0A5M3MBI0_CONPW|nr:uncharacterized protein CONPUDRAFT_84579 [Coniophora puteana RWD-64-598 SS2]EIW76599.1 hypothetical protein CONPUDRAFT_84579 [Coniophora puteana RWD-64-598 SS2]
MFDASLLAADISLHVSVDRVWTLGLDGDFIPLEFASQSADPCFRRHVRYMFEKLHHLQHQY